jgi:hypothetical protein
MIVKKQLLLLLVCLAAVTSEAKIYQNGQAFLADIGDGTTMVFQVIDWQANTCMIGNPKVRINYEEEYLTYYQRVRSYTGEAAPTGTFTVPSKVTADNGVVYTVTKIGEFAFEDWTEATEFVLPPTITEIGWGAFLGCSALKSLTVPEGVRTIGPKAFEMRFVGSGTDSTPDTSLEQITLPTTLDSIGSYAFQNCTRLKSITLPAGFRALGLEVFSGCKSLTSFHLPAGVEYMRGGLFQNCPAMKTITVDAANTHFDGRGGCNGIVEKQSQTFVCGCSESTLPDGILAIGRDALRSYGKSSIRIPDGVKSIGNYAFYDAALTTLDLPTSIRTLEGAAFQNCLITHLVLPLGLRSIGGYCFANCPLVEVTIPATVSEIGNSAFYNDRMTMPLERVCCYVEKPFWINTDVFAHYGNYERPWTDATLYVPQGTKALYEAKNSWNKFSNIVENLELVPTAISRHADNAPSAMAAEYGVDGRQAMRSGLRITRLADGTTRKTLR